MARGISSAMTSLALGGEVKPLLLVEALFDSNAPSSYIYLWNGIGDLSHDSKTYIGAGDLLSISTIQESVELQANGVTLQLAGVGDPLLSKAKTENYQGREVNIKLGGFDASNSIIADPVIVFSGFMDTMTITDDGQIGTIALTVENRLIEFEKTRVRRFTDNDQRIDYPNDDGLEYVTQIQDKQIVWGNSNANPPNYGNPIRNIRDRR
ncbi:MAG: hypothetical protein Unbinned2819contig1003_39 [Prokaryotic dsDNA virus sp.]|nr:MAG: hypothetical protein Unbinned2819contig1003_39 [Prokaryotic dsDNA virus sp.]|tara:strand:- start:25755 stop:26381 length:627 start_codon:yes stop_codon:yes gene_type:complete